MHQLLKASLLVLLFSGRALAGPVSPITPERTPFDKGNTELEAMAGAFWGVGTKGTDFRPDIGYALASLRYGWMLTDPAGDGFFRGNWEFLLGGFVGSVFEGPGSIHAGADLNLRYNFIQPDAKVVPFFQISAGGVYSDVYSDDKAQSLLGSDWNFALGSSIGLRWMLSENTALTTAFGYRHFSNATAATTPWAS